MEDDMGSRQAERITPNRQKPIVWFVDDLQTNLDDFHQRHDAVFDVRTTTNPNEIKSWLKIKRPDALLCDVFFYPPDRATHIEDRVKQEAARMEAFAHDIVADKDSHITGIELMEDIAELFGKNKEVPFPMFAYTSKAPYLLNQSGWDRIVKCGGTVLLKNRFGFRSEQRLIQKAIDSYKRSWWKRLRDHSNTVLVEWSMASAAIGALVTYALCKLG
jgi:hypothetical protein